MTHPITKEQLAEFIWQLDNKRLLGGTSSRAFSDVEEKAKVSYLDDAQAILDKVFEGAVKGKVVQSKDPFDSDPKNEPFVMATTYDGACKLLQFLCESGGVIVLLAPAQDAKAEVQG